MPIVCGNARLGKTLALRRVLCYCQRMTLQERLHRIVTLMYDTGVSLDELEREVCPYLAPDVAFKDPVLRARGFDKVAEVPLVESAMIAALAKLKPRLISPLTF